MVGIKFRPRFAKYTIPMVDMSLYTVSVPVPPRFSVENTTVENAEKYVT